MTQTRLPDQRRSWAERVLGCAGCSDSAFNLGAARVIVFATMLYSVERWAPCIEAVSRLPPEMMNPPRIMRTLVDWAPPSGTVAIIGLWSLRVVGVCGLIGLWPRTMCLLACALCTYVFGLLWCFGATFHMLHHFPMLLAILAASPCGDALSVGARRAGCAPGSGVAYGLPLRAMAVTLGLIYLFPGAWKLATNPVGWLDGECLRTVIWRDWGLGGPRVRIDQWPAVLPVLGTLTILYEVLFLPLALWRRSRAGLAMAGVLFHSGITLVTGIDFIAFSMCLLVLIDWHKVRCGRAVVPEPAPLLIPKGRSMAPLACVCLFIWTMLTITGVRDTHNAWPIAAYPTFAWVGKPEQLSALAFEVRPDGSEREIAEEPMQAIFDLNWWKVRQNLGFGRVDDPRLMRQRLAFLRHWAKLAGLDPERLTLRLYGVIRSTRPEDQGAPPLSSTLLIESNPAGDARTGEFDRLHPK